MAELMEEVLLLGRFDAGKMNFDPVLLDLRSLCERIVSEVTSANGGACSIRLQFNTDVKAVRTDERLLRHILTNLLTNAVKYSEPGSPVELVVESEPEKVVFKICDYGIGIPEADQQWLFNAFHRARNVGNRPGTGLGLVIVKRCAELHGGSISLTSKTGEGTTATVSLPMDVETRSA